jgi:hypothetical protein
MGLSDTLSDEVVDDGKGVVLVEPEFEAGEGEGTPDGDVAGAVAGAGLVLGKVAAPGADEFGIPEADFGSAEGCVWPEIIQAEQASNENVKNR